jgi:hypothetical protein
MSFAVPSRVFISYSRKDGTDFAEKLRDEFSGIDRGLGFGVKDPLPLWRDIDNLRSGEDWWSQIEAALRSKTVEHLVIVVTPEALRSPVIRREIRLARQEEVQVSAIAAPEFVLKSVPRWLGHVVDPAIPQQRAMLLQTLYGPSTQKRMPMMAGGAAARLRQSSD